MNKSLHRKILVLVIFMSLSGLGTFGYEMYSAFASIKKLMPDKSDLAPKNFDKAFKIVKEDVFEEIGPIEFDKMVKENMSTYDHQSGWNILRIKRNNGGDSNFTMSLINEHYNDERFSFIVEGRKPDNEYDRKLIPEKFKETMSGFSVGTLVYVSWKNFRYDEYTGASVLTDIRLATDEEINKYLEAERKSDEKLYGAYEEPEFDRILYKIKEQEFEDIGPTRSFHLLMNKCDDEYNHKKVWSIMTYKELYNSGARIGDVDRKDGYSQYCSFMTPSLFRPNFAGECLITPQYETYFKELPADTKLYLSFKNLKVHKKNCFYIIDEARPPTPEEVNTFEFYLTPQGERKVGKFAKFYK